MTEKDHQEGAGDDIVAEYAQSTSDPEAQVSEIRESIEQTRAHMTETIDELQERLSPARLKRQAKETVRDATIGKVQNMAERVTDTMQETRRSIVDTLTANPIPTALVGIGLAWLWMNRSAGTRRDDMSRGQRQYDEFGYRHGSASGADAYDYGRGQEWDVAGAARSAASRAGSAVSGFASQAHEAAGNLADKAKATAGDMVDTAKATATNVADKAKATATTVADKARSTVTSVVGQTQQSARQLANQAQYQAQRVEDRFTATLEENPLAVGAVALAVGAVVGLAIPQTRKEHELMGEARDTLVDKAQVVAHDAMDQVQEVAQRVTQQMGERTEQDQAGGTA